MAEYRLTERQLHAMELPSDPDRALRAFLDGCEQASLPETLIACMDEDGIDQTVILPLDFSLEMGDSAVGFEEQNRQCCELARVHPDRLISFVGVDPRRRQAGLAVFEEGVRNWGARGLKLVPSGFWANDPVCTPFYEKALEYDLPVLIHTGIAPPPHRAKYGNPLALDDVCSQFPGLRVVAAHAGSVGGIDSWHQMAVRLARMHKNLYLDVAATQAAYAVDPGRYLCTLRKDLDLLGPETFLFGTDYPYVRGRGLDPGAWADVFRNLRRNGSEHGIEFAQEEVDGVLHRNAEQWLGPI